MSGFQLPFGIQPVNPVAVDYWSGPYTATTLSGAISAANAAIPSGVRFQTLEVRLLVGASAPYTTYKYWYSTGTSDSDLKPFQAANSVTGSGVSTQIAYWNSSNTITGDPNFTWNSSEGYISIGYLSNPTGTPTISTSTSGGTLAAGTYYYCVVAVDIFGNQTLPGTEVSQTTTGSSSTITINWDPVPNTSLYYIYQGTASGLQTKYLIASSNTSSITDNGSGYITGASLPTINTATKSAIAQGLFNNIKIGSTTYGHNLSIGEGNNLINTTISCIDNTGIGTSVLENLSSGNYNSGFGYQSLQGLVTGDGNIGIGTGSGRYYGSSGYSLITVMNNSIYIGYSSRGSSSSTSNEIVIGNNSIGIGNNTSVIGNTLTNLHGIFGRTLIGVGSLPSDDGSVLNVAGNVSISNTVTAGGGIFNSDISVNGIRIGTGSGTDDTSVLIGATSGSSITTGKICNVCIGYLTGSSITSATHNTIIGTDAGWQLTSGLGNTLYGNGSGSSLTTGYQNTFIGISSGNVVTTGYYNTILGNYYGSSGMHNNVILADGQGNRAYQWDGTNHYLYSMGNGSYSSILYYDTSTGLVKYGSLPSFTSPNSVTFNSSGSGGASGSTFNGSSPLTVSYNTIGAQAASTILTTLSGLANSSGYLQNNGSGVLSWVTPSSGTFSQWTNLVSPSTTIYYSAGNVLIGTSTDASSGVLQVTGNQYVTGNITASGTITATAGGYDSDIRLKRNILYNPKIEKIDEIKIASYTINNEFHYGYIAQDIEKIIPSAIIKKDDGFLAVQYHEVLVAKVQYLENTIDELKSVLTKNNLI